ncbi:H/ACA snoRNP pseudouridylase subunit [Saxophila tyrrhenica]|uniref:H/ACA ribonucleoprotein complex subunit n=1 Tax=Saxophila tyrrhenica TaxID=1690608 RepID=A0AAV9PGG0_9PEZI|nr:H/ACA snoRNP pseudouridylase subunit [Saxophila tyrrhenica]
MSFRGGFRGGDRGGRGGFSRGGGRGGFQSYGPPDQVYEMGQFMHATEGELVCESINPKIPYFNAPIYLENKTSIGKVDEILGPLNQVFFTIKPQEGIQATSFKQGDKFFIGGDKLLPLEKFLPKPKPPPGAARVKKASRGGDRGGRGGRGGFTSRGRGAPRGRGGPPGRGGSRGFSSRGGSGFSSRGRGAPRSRGRGY